MMSVNDISRVRDPLLAAELTLQAQRRLRSGGGSSEGRHQRRRLAKDFRRRAKIRYAATHGVTLPAVPPPPAFRDVQTGNVSVILLPKSAPRPAAIAEQLDYGGGPGKRAGRKHRQAFLRGVLRDRPEALASILGAGRPLRQRVAIAGAAAAQSGRLQLQALDNVGAVLAVGLDAETARRLEAAGATVLTNQVISILEPVDGAVVDAPGMLVPATTGHDGGPGRTRPGRFPEEPWHLAHVAPTRLDGRSGQGSAVGFLDTGIDANHPEFAGRHVHYAQFAPDGTWIKGQAPRDFDRHGTHVAALAVGRTVGVAPRAALAMAAVLTTRQDGRMVGYAAQILAGLNWLVDELAALGGDPPIVNASLSSPSPTAFQAMVEHVKGGVILVAASGNAGAACGFPAALDGVIAVGATDRMDAVAAFSNWTENAKPDICAPGVDIFSAVPERRGNPAYALLSGTSMAAPLVAGAIAELFSRDPSFPRDAARILKTLGSRAHPVKPSERGGAGRLAI